MGGRGKSSGKGKSGGAGGGSKEMTFSSNELALDDEKYYKTRRQVSDKLINMEIGDKFTLTENYSPREREVGTYTKVYMNKFRSESSTPYSMNQMMNRIMQNNGSKKKIQW